MKIVKEKSFAGLFFAIADFVFLGVGTEGGGRGEEGGGNRHARDNIPCSSLADEVN